MTSRKLKMNKVNEKVSHYVTEKNNTKVIFHSFFDDCIFLSFKVFRKYGPFQIEM